MNVVEADIAASHIALLALTGRSVMGVFHTLFEGKTGQFVPASTVWATGAMGIIDEGLERTVAIASTPGIDVHAAVAITIALQASATRRRNIVLV
jgi:hypothetical protein